MPELEDSCSFQEAGNIPGPVRIPGLISGPGPVEEECLYPVSPRLLPSRSPYVQPRPLTSHQLRNILKTQPSATPAPTIPFHSVQGTFLQSLFTKNPSVVRSNNTITGYSTIGNIHRHDQLHRLHDREQENNPPPLIARPSSISIPFTIPGFNIPTTNPQGLRNVRDQQQNAQQLQRTQLQPR